MELDALEAAVEHLATCDLSAYGDAESVERLEKVLSRVEYIVTAAVGAFDVSGAWAPSGARTPAAWLRTTCGVPSTAARAQVHRSRELRHLPRFEAAWSLGELISAHLDVVSHLRTERTEAALERDEALLASQATKLGFSDFVRVARYWGQHADPDGAEADAMERRARRDVYLVPSMGDMFLGKMTLDPISGTIVSGELERLERELFEADWTKAKDELGRDPHVEDLPRTPNQRRADALVEMATRSAAMPAESRRPEPLFSVLVGYETLHGRICELAHNGIVLSPGSLLPWLDQAYVERAVFSPGGRVEVGITSRFFTGGTRRALELRDQRCTHPFCEEPVQRCQGDHIDLYTQGGPTTQENGRLLCAFHNRLRNQRPPPEE